MGLKAEVHSEKESAARLKRLCEDLEAQVRSHDAVDKQLRDLSEHRAGLLQKLEGELSQSHRELAAEKERTLEMQMEIHRMQRDIANKEERGASMQNELQQAHDEIAKIALEKAENKYFLQQTERLAEENQVWRGTCESAKQLRDDLEVERGSRRAAEQQRDELQEMSRHRETVIKHLETSFENLQRSLKLSEEEVAFHKKQHEAAKVETGQEKTRSAHFEQALEEHRSLLARLEAGVEETHVESTRMRMELQQSQWELKREQEKSEHNRKELERVQAESKMHMEKCQLDVDKHVAKLAIQAERQVELEKLCDELGVQLAVKTEIETQLKCVKKQQEELNTLLGLPRDAVLLPPKKAEETFVYREARDGGTPGYALPLLTDEDGDEAHEFFVEDPTTGELRTALAAA